MTTREILIAARKRIEKPENWHQWVSFDGPRICATESLAISIPEHTAVSNHPAYKALSAVINYTPLNYYNDTHNHVDIIAAFDRAIARETLIEARAKIADEYHWTRGVMESEDGERMCVLGAIYSVDRASITKNSPVYLALRAAMNVGDAQVGHYNDNHTHAEVLAALDAAIKSFEAGA
jgi:hypothetical protein